MQVVLGGNRVTLAAEHALGDGGEATVLAHGDLAIKVYHQPSQRRADKLHALMSLAARLPDAVVAPRELVYDARGRQVVGFAMRALGAGHQVVAALARASARAAAQMGTGDVARLFLHGHETLAAIHRAGIVVGDLNDLNELWARGPSGAVTMAWIDADSFQLPGFPCEVATEAFLDPLLYGPDRNQVARLPRGARAFGPDSDWYAYAVLLFRSLTQLHPFGGVDPRLPRLADRALAGRSVMSPGVRAPRQATASIELLSPELARELAAVFERGKRGVFPRAVLQSFVDHLVRCATCGVEHAARGGRCPLCAARGAPAIAGGATAVCVRDLAELDGDAVALAASGTLLFVAALSGGSLSLHVLDAAGVVAPREVPLGPAPARCRVAVGATLVAIADDAGPARLVVRATAPGDGRSVVLSTERVPDTGPTFVCSGDALFRVANGTLLRGRFTAGGWDEVALATVMRDQTRLLSGSTTPAGDVVVASSRVFGERRVLAVVGGRRVELPVAPPDLGEAVEDEAAAIAERTLLYLRRAVRSGRGSIHAALFDHAGTALAAVTVDSTKRPAFGRIDGVALRDGTVLSASAFGIGRERLGAAGWSGEIVAGTEPFCTDDALLAPLPTGLALAAGRRVRILSRS